MALMGAGVTGQGQTPSAEDYSTCLRLLNQIIAQWRRKRWIIWSLVDTAFVSTGAISYTVGPTGNFPIARPDRLEAAYFRQNAGQANPVDYPLTIIQAREDYSAIALKKLNSFPEYAFYDSAYPIGNLFVWPVPSSQYEIHILTKTDLPYFVNQATAMVMPDEYEPALMWLLSQLIRPMYQLPPEPSINMACRNALAVLRNANAQIPSLQVPRDVVRNGRYNIYSDRNY